MSQTGRKSFPFSSLAMIVLGVFFLLSSSPTKLGWVLIVLLFIGGGLGMLLWLVSNSVPTNAGDAADQILTTQKALYSGLHEFRQADPREFRGADLAFYDNTQKYLERQGFRALGDVEDVTATREFPQMRSFLRVLSGDAGAVTAAVYHVNLRGLFRLMQFFGAVPKQLKIIDLETELSDGTFLVTCNFKGADTTGPVPRITRFQYSSETTAEELLRLHREQVEQARRRDAAVVPVLARTLEEVLASQNRLQEIKNAHKQKMGFMDSKELESIAGQWTPQVQEVADEIERRKRQ
ncbi:MAG: hypothetical protein ABIP55_12405 [Tepidisphaeraceae bacterium]